MSLTLTYPQEKFARLHELTLTQANLLAPPLMYEHPQVIATVLAMMKSGKAAKLLALFPPRLRNDVLLRMTCLDSVTSQALSILDRAADRMLVRIAREGLVHPVDTIKGAARVAERLDQEQRAACLAYIRDEAPTITAELEQQMSSSFDELPMLSGRQLKLLIKKTPSSSLLVALKGARKKLRKRLLAKVSKRTARTLQKGLERMPPVSVSEAAQAQRSIQQYLHEMAEEARPVLPG